jgi:hypothetical protein
VVVRYFPGRVVTLVELLLLKVPIPCFYLELFILVVLCSMLKVGGIQF